MQLPEEDGGDGDAVKRFEIVSHVYREGCQFAEGLKLKKEGDDGEDRP